MESVRGRAGFAAVAEFRSHRTLDGGVEIGVVEHQERRVAAEFERCAQQRPAGGFGERAAHPGRSGEGELPQPWVLEEGSGDGARV